MKFTFVYLSIFLSSICLFAQTDGQIDSTFGNNGITFSNFTSVATGTSVGIDNQQNIIAVGQVYSLNQYDFAAIKFNSQGSIDTSFATDGKFTYGFGLDDFCTSVAIQSDNKIILGGYSSNWDGFNVNSIFSQFSLVRIHNNGVIDSTFGVNGRFELDFDPIDCGAVAIALQSNGNIIAVGKYNNGSSLQIIAIRITSNGNLDLNFGNNGITKIQIDTIAKDDEATCCIIQPDDKILIGCYTNDQPFVGKVFGMLRLTQDGFKDLSFGTLGVVKTDIPDLANDYPTSVKLQPDGKVLLAGTTKNSKIMAICRYNIDGTHDNTFGNLGIDTLNISSGKDVIRDIMVLEDEKIIIVGESDNNACILRLNKYGKIDSTFNNTGINTYGNSIGEGFYNVHKMSPSKIITSAYAKDSNQIFQLSVAAFTSILFSGINETTAPASIPLVVPNPANETISLKNIQPNTLITITNITGNIVLQTTINQSNQINTSHLSSGIYFIQAQSRNYTQTTKFIKQ